MALALLASCRAEPPKSGLDRLEEETGTPWIAENDPNLGTPAFLMPQVDARPSGAAPLDTARAFLAQHGDVFGIAVADLALEEEDREMGNLAEIRFAQSHGGIAAFG